MSTFILSTNIKNKQELLDRSKFSGLDLTTVTNYDKFVMVYNLLHVTGELTRQPYTSSDRDFYLLGEMYNYVGTSELENIASLYEEHGDHFTNYIDGEFLIIVVDKNKLCVDLFTDPWSTRQLYSSGDTLSTLEFEGSIRLLHNSHYRWDRSLELITNNLHTWNLKQYKDNLVDIHSALERACVKRWHPNGVLLLSGGVDSSAVAVCLQNNQLPISTYSLDFAGIESKENLNKVLQYCNIHTSTYINEPYKERLLIGLAKQVRKDNKYVILAGNGSDSVFENCRNHKNREKTPNEFDKFPDNLDTVFPWYHFYGGGNRLRCDRWETAFLSCGIEQRNAFLDKNLVQEYLWLTPELKNLRHKHFLKAYLEQAGIALDYISAGFIFHMAFCGATATWSVLDGGGDATGLTSSRKAKYQSS